MANGHLGHTIFLSSFLRASPTREVKIATEKVQISTLATHFSKHNPTVHSLFSLNIVFYSFSYLFIFFHFSLTLRSLPTPLFFIGNRSDFAPGPPEITPLVSPEEERRLLGSGAVDAPKGGHWGNTGKHHRGKRSRTGKHGLRRFGPTWSTNVWG
jgi:hypothetical protein